ncbi:MAG: response regulator transcription factor [Actinobacteria bacterium]|nr:response regulator transcription factor [Actinomycetota bacterium]
MTDTADLESEVIKVLLVDDHRILREGLRALLSEQAGLVVVGDASDGEEAVALVAESHPDVVVMDMVMPRMSGLEATALIRKLYPQVRVLILSMYDDDEYVQRVIQAGASGYVLKGVAADDLVRAIREVHRGSSFLQPTIAAKLIEDYVRRVRGDPPAVIEAPRREVPAGDEEPLTLREREVLALIASGNTNQRIADLLELSRKTVESHRTNIMKKLAAHDVTELVRYAIRTGLIPVD